MIIFGASNSSYKAQIPDDILRNIKAKDPDPVIKVFVIAHEGEASPMPGEVGNQSVRLFFSRDVIKAFVPKVIKGLKGFFLHDGYNSPARKQIAEIVHGFADEVNGKLSSLAAVWIKDKNYKDVDVASFEVQAKVDWKKSVVDFIDNIESVAFGYAKDMKPAFPGAVSLETIFAFQSTDEKSTTGEPKMPTRAEIIQGVRDLNLTPSQIFDSHEILGSIDVAEGKLEFVGGDERIVGILKKKIGKDFLLVNPDEFAKAKDAKAKYDKIAPEYGQIITSKKRDAMKSEIEQIAKARGLSEKHTKFLLNEESVKAFALTEDKDARSEAEAYVLSESGKYEAYKKAGLIADDNSSVVDAKNENEGLLPSLD